LSCHLYSSLIYAIRLPAFKTPTTSHKTSIQGASVESDAKPPTTSVASTKSIVNSGESGDCPSKRKRKRRFVSPPPTTNPQTADALGEMAKEKSRLDKISSDEYIRLLRLNQRVNNEVAKKQGLYWDLKREALVSELLSKGQTVSDIFKTTADQCPLLSGVFDQQIGENTGQRKVILMVTLEYVLIHQCHESEAYPF
jgi:hypothetical protein